MTTVEYYFKQWIKRKPNNIEKEFYSNLYNKDYNILNKVFKHISKCKVDLNKNLCSYSQCAQDLFVYYNYYKEAKNDGFYIEMGAGDGIYISNTNLLKEKNWKGILIEPSSNFNKLVLNRKNDICVNALVSNKVESLEYLEINDKGQKNCDNNALLSKVKLHNSEWLDTKLTNYGEVIKKCTLQTTTLESLLDKYNCPKIIDYFSLDVEGMEYKVLKNFPFKKYKIRLLGIEKPELTELHKLLDAHFIYINRCGDDYFYKSKYM